MIEIDAFIDDDEKSPFHLRISSPKKVEKTEDWYCRVHAPSLFKRDKDIFGIDEEQAEQLAIRFVKLLLDGKRLIDNDGEPIEPFAS